MGQIMREDIQIKGIVLGAQNTELEQCHPFSLMSAKFILQQLFLPWIFGKKIDLTLVQALKTILFFASRLFGGETRPKTFKDLETRAIGKSLNTQQVFTA